MLIFKIPSVRLIKAVTYSPPYLMYLLRPLSPLGHYTHLISFCLHMHYYHHQHHFLLPKRLKPRYAYLRHLRPYIVANDENTRRPKEKGERTRIEYRQWYTKELPASINSYIIQDVMSYN